MSDIEYSRTPHPMEPKPLAIVEVIDVAAHAIEVFGEETARELLPPGAPFREHDYRFHVVLPSGAQCTFSQGATADHIAAYLQREGVTS